MPVKKEISPDDHLNNNPLKFNVRFYRFLKFFKGACQLIKHYYFFHF